MATQVLMSSAPLMQTLFGTGEDQKGLSVMQQAMLVIAGSILLALSAHIKVPFYPVPVTMQTMIILMIGVTYGSRLGALTILAYTRVDETFLSTRRDVPSFRPFTRTPRRAPTRRGGTRADPARRA